MSATDLDLNELLAENRSRLHRMVRLRGDCAILGRLAQLGNCEQVAYRRTVGTVRLSHGGAMPCRKNVRRVWLIVSRI